LDDTSSLTIFIITPKERQKTVNLHFPRPSLEGLFFALPQSRFTRAGGASLCDGSGRGNPLLGAQAADKQAT
jgi:hypothetical protein